MKKFGKLAKGIASVMALVLAFTVVFSNGLTAKAATETKEIFSGGANESYESNDASWLMNADDSDVIKIVYTCTDDTHAGWGVLGWGATVDDNWKDGPGLSASESDATAKVTAKVTAGDLKKTLGIKDGSNVSFIKLGAWNGGKIESLSISGAGAASAGSSASSESTSESAATEEVVIQAPAELTGDYLYLIDEAKTLTIWPAMYLQYWNPGTTIYLKIEMESNGSFGGCLGTCVNKWAWQMEEFSSDTGSTITVNWFLTPIMDNIQLQFWWMSGTQIGIKSIEVVKAIDYRVPQDFFVEEEPDDSEATVNVNLADVAVASGEVLFSGNGTSSGWGQAVSIDTTVWGGTFDATSIGTNDYVVVDYSSEKLPELILQEPWTKINPCYAENGVAIFSYADMFAAYGDFSAAGRLHIGDTDADLTVTSVRVVDATQIGNGGSTVATPAPTEVPTAVPTEAPSVAPTEVPTAAPTEAPTEAPTATPTEVPTAAPTEAPASVEKVIYGNDSETYATTGWSDFFKLEADNFADLKFDGTEKLIITYSSTDGNYGKNTPCMKVVCADPYTSHLQENVWAPVNTLLKEIVLTSEWADIASGGLAFQGTDWIISKVEVAEVVETTSSSIYSGSAEPSWSESLIIDAAKFAGLKFDGTEKLLITYSSVDSTQWGSQLKLSTNQNYTSYVDSTNLAAVSSPTVVELVLTSEMAGFANDGMNIQGWNSIVSDISIAK